MLYFLLGIIVWSVYIKDINATTPTVKLKIAVATFTPKAPKYKRIDPEGKAFSDMLITALFKTDHFIILEREILKELEEEVAKPQKEWLGADVMISGAITAFEPDYKKRKIDIGSIFKTLGCIFTLFTGKKSSALETLAATEAKIETKQSYIAIDLRIVEVKTRKILGATRVESLTKDVEWDLDLSAFSKSIGLVGTFREYRNTPLEKAIYECLYKAVNYIIEVMQF